jgi:hypothetical protein
MDKRIRELESGLTNLALRGTGLVVTDEDKEDALNISQEIYDLSMGKNEVIWDSLGRPSIMFNFYPDKTSRLDWLSNLNALFTAPSTRFIHPAFIVNGQIVKKLQVGKYTATRVANINYPCSLYGLEPAHTISYDSAVTMCDTAAGTAGSLTANIHLSTKMTMGYLALLSARLGFYHRGNDLYGKSYLTSEYGKAGYTLDANGHITRTLTGTGPLSWRHDGSPFGIEMRPGVAQWGGGYRTLSGEINIFENNNAAIPHSDHSLSSTNWKAILEDGTLATSGTALSLKWDFTNDVSGETTGAFPFILNNTLLHQQPNADIYGVQSFSTLTAYAGVTVPVLLQLAGIMPPSTNKPAGNSYMRNFADLERVAYLLGYWSYASVGGFGYSGGYYSRTHAVYDIGFRPASYVA